VLVVYIPSNYVLVLKSIYVLLDNKPHFSNTKKKTILKDNRVIDLEGDFMAKNREIFRKYQREINNGNTKHSKVLDKHAISTMLRYVKKDFDKITKDDLVAFFNDINDGKF
jgi:hypothetical protein